MYNSNIFEIEMTLAVCLMGFLFCCFLIKSYPFRLKNGSSKSESLDSNIDKDILTRLGFLWLDPKVEEEIWVSESDKHRVRRIIKISLIFLFAISVSLIFYELVLVGDGCIRDGDYVACPE